MKGVYALIVQVHQEISIEVGSMGTVRFTPGDWVYIGSAMGTTSTRLEHRLRRHFSSNKRKHWHIDYLLESPAVLVEALFTETDVSMECELATAMSESDSFEKGPEGFGASDCKAECGTHIFRLSKQNDASKVIKEIFQSRGLQSKRVYDEDALLSKY